MIGIAPSEFWRMTPAEFWLLVEQKQEYAEKASGRLTEREKRDLYAILKGS